MICCAALLDNDESFMSSKQPNVSVHDERTRAATTVPDLLNEKTESGCAREQDYKLA